MRYAMLLAAAGLLFPFRCAFGFQQEQAKQEQPGPDRGWLDQFAPDHRMLNQDFQQALVLQSLKQIMAEVQKSGGADEKQLEDISRLLRELQASAQGTRTITPFEIFLTIGVLVFGLVVIGAEIYLIGVCQGYSESWSFKMIALTLVIVASLFLVVAGYSERQITPVIGLLGAVAGYLFGREASATTEPRSPAAKPVAPPAHPVITEPKQETAEGEA